MKKEGLTENTLGQGEGGEMAEKRGGWKGALMAVLAVLLLLGAAIGGLYAYVQYNLQPVAAAEDEVLVSIPKGANTAEIARILYEHGLIRHVDIFRYYVRYKGVGARLQAGDYLFRPGMTMDEIIGRMVNGDVHVETFTFTVPEGYTVTQIADLLAQKGYADREKFLYEVNHGRFDYDFVAAIPKDPDRKYRLEGYLFPETYEMKRGATEHEIIDRMLAQFEKVLTDKWREELKRRGMTIDQAVILASIVEREAVLDKERPIIAGVFYNRLKEGWLLQSCATVQFVLGKQKDVITYADLEVDSPYNTYRNPGLPPGPIANPGKASLEACVYPAKHDFYFFVTKKDGSGEHYFSRTFDEHKKNNAKSHGSW